MDFVDQYFDELSAYREEDCLFINFDESSLCFDLSKDKTLDKKGANQVKIITHTNEKETCTIATGITSDGETLITLIIFKYKHTGTKKTKREYPKKYEAWTKITAPCMTRFSGSGFNNTKIMAEWISALNRNLKLKNEERKVVLLLDSAACHKGTEIDKAIEGTQISIVYIPGGCTSFLQPLDTSVNKYWKATNINFLRVIINTIMSLS